MLADGKHFMSARFAHLSINVYVALTTAKRVILRHCAGKNNPAYSEWLNALTETASYEQLIYKSNGRMNVYTEIWEPFLTQIRDGQSRN